MVLLVVSQTSPNSAAQVWSEDFQGGLEDWELHAYFWDYSNVWWQKYSHGFEIIDGALTAPQSTTLNNTEVADHPSTVEYGTWSFDWKMADGGIGYDVFIFIMTDDGTEYNATQDTDFRFGGYGVLMALDPDTTQPEVRLIEYLGPYADSFAVLHAVSALPADVRDRGTLHFDITRNQEGEIKVYVDDELTLKYTDDSIHVAAWIQWLSWLGDTAIDNIEVRDDVIDPNKDDTPLLMIPIIFTFALIVLIRKKK
ncbi:MAG: hypothetical protein ACXAD7_27140 [Candidatus Kariarchaeaceae archaeon]